MRSKQLTRILAWIFILYTLHITLYTSTALCASKGNPPVAHWRFDESGGPYTYDDNASSPTHRGTLNAGATGSNTAAGHMWYPQGKFGGCLEFDGDDHVECEKTNLEILGDITLEAWIKRAVNGVNHNIIRKGDWAVYEMRISSGDKLQFGHYTPSESVTSIGSVLAGEWHHVVVTRSSGNVSLYIDGKLDNTGTTVNDTDPHNEVLVIGLGHHPPFQTPFNGLIDDVRIYNYARAADQVLVDYNAGSAAHLGAGTDPNEGNPPAGYWTLDENTGTTAYDRSGNGNNGTLTNMESTDWVVGKYGLALQFDGGGSNEYVSLSKINSLEGASNYTISAWIKTTVAQNGGVVGQFDNGSHIIAIHIGSDGITSFITYEGGYSNVSSNTTVNSGQWRYIAIVKSGTTGRIYIDGVEKNSGTVMNVVSTTEIRIGTRENGAYPFNGLIDDVKIYNYARTQAQIAYDYNKGKPVAHYKFDEGGGAISHNEYSSADTGSAPVGWWRMDETSWNGTANEVIDSSGKANNGVRVGDATTSASSKIGPYAGTFDGTGDYINLGATTNLNFIGSSDFTFSAWAYETALPPSAGAAHILFNIYQDANNSYQIGILDHSDNSLDGFYLRSAKAGVHKYFSDRNLSSITGSWRFLTVVYSNTAQSATLYVNGAVVTSYTLAAEVIGIGAAKYIGSRGSDYHWNGKIDDVRIYNYARTAEQIYNDYKTTHGTLVGDTKFVDGKMGKALQFDGTEDYVDVPDGSATRPVDLTLECWVKHTNNSATQVYVAKQVGAGSGNSYAIYYTSGLLRGTVGDSSGNGTEITYSWTPTTGQWYHLVYAFDDSSDTQKLYIDGKQVNSNSVTKSIGYNDSPVTISYDFNLPNKGSPGYSVYGQMDDVRIYNYARTADQILQDYNAGATTRLGAQSAGIADPWGGALPVAHWKLDENTGVLANDASGNGNNGTLANMETSDWISGKNGSGLYFNEDNEKITLTSPFSKTGNEFTVSLWHKRSSHTASNIWRTLLCREGGTYHYLLYNPDQNNAEMSIYNTARYGLGYNVPDDNQWHHYTVIYHSASVDLYVDGVYRGFTSTMFDSVTYPLALIGNYGGGTQPAGYIDDVKFYNYARTQAQIAWDYNQGKPVGHWRFDEGSGAAAYDESDNNNDGTITIGATGSQTTVASAWTNGATGKFGKCMSFDGTDDYVSASHSSSLTVQGDLTLSAWIKTSSKPASDYRVIAAKTGSVSLWPGYEWAINSNGALSIWTSDGSSGAWTDDSGYDLSNNVWHHVAARLSGTTMQFYVDGVAKGSFTKAIPGSNSVMFAIGKTSYSAARYWNGLIDDVRVYNYARTADQIQQDYLNGAAARLGD